MSLPTIYPGSVGESVGPTDIIPVYPPIETVVLRNHVAVLATQYMDTYASISLLDTTWHMIASMTIAAQPVDCNVVLRSLTSISTDATTGISMFARVNTVDTIPIGSYLPSSTSTASAPAQVALQATSQSVAAGEEIVVEIYAKIDSASDSSTLSTSLYATVSPSILLA